MFGVALLLILAAALFTIYCDYKQGKYGTLEQKLINPPESVTLTDWEGKHEYRITKED